MVEIPRAITRDFLEVIVKPFVHTINDKVTLYE